jgi:hypothetical protein
MYTLQGTVYVEAARHSVGGLQYNDQNQEWTGLRLAAPPAMMAGIRRF